MTSRYDWLLFDADNTLLDYRAAEAHALKTALTAFGFSVNDDVRALYHRINSALWARLEQGTITSAELRIRRFEELSAELGWTMDAAAFSGAYLAELGRAGFMMDGAREMLDGLPPDAGKAIITNGIRDVQYGRLKDAGILGLFDPIIISEDAGVAKPAAGFFDYALERIGSRDLSKMLVIGDSLSSDIAGGIGCGIDTCWFNPGGLENATEIRPTFEIRGWDGLFAILSG